MPKKTHDVPLSAQALEEKFDNNGDTDADFDWAAARRPGEGVGGQRTEDRGQRTDRKSGIRLPSSVLRPLTTPKPS